MNLRRWWKKWKLQREMNAFIYFEDFEMAHEVRRELRQLEEEENAKSD